MDTRTNLTNQCANAILPALVAKAQEKSITISRPVSKLVDAQHVFPGLTQMVDDWINKNAPGQVTVTQVMQTRSVRVYYQTNKLTTKVEPATPTAATTATGEKTPLTNEPPKYKHRNLWGKPDFEILRGAYHANPPIPVLITGPKGVGKTRCLSEYTICGEKERIRYIRVNLNGGLSPEDLIGCWISNPNLGLPMVDSEGKLVLDSAGVQVIDHRQFVWADGVLTFMVRKGGCIVVDELNAAPPEITFVLHSLLDDERTMVLVQKDGEVLKAHENFWLCATYNPDYAGTRPVNEALKDRFGIQIQMEADPDVENAIFKNPKIQMLAKMLRTPKAKAKLGDISTRALLFLEANIERFGSRFAFQSFVTSVSGDYAGKEALKMLGEIGGIFDSANLAALEDKIKKLGL